MDTFLILEDIAQDAGLFDGMRTFFPSRCATITQSSGITKIMKFSLNFLILVAISGCSTMENVKQPENKVTLTFNKNYQTVYRIIVQNSQACSSPQQFKTNLFSDNRTASITEVTENFTGYTIDIMEAADGGTKVDLYLGFAAQRKFLPQRIGSWINDGETKCKYNGYPLFGPE